MMRFLHLADLHLGWQPGFLPADEATALQKERDEILARAVAFALEPEQQIRLVIIAGDLFETHHPPTALTELVIRQLTKLTAAGVTVVTVPGNHDEITYRDSVYRREKERWPGLLVTNPMPALAGRVKIDDYDVYFYSLAYTGGVTVTDPPLAIFPPAEGEGFHIGILHGSYNWDAGDRSLPLNPDGLARAGYDYVALGHFHTYQTYTLGRGVAAYCGAVAGKGFHDLGEGHLLTGTWRPGRGVQLERVPFSAPCFHKEVIDITEAVDEEALAARLAVYEGGAEFLRVELEGVAGFPIDTWRLEQRLAHGFRHLAIVDRSFLLDTEALERWAQERTITGFFLMRMKRQLDEAASEEEKLLLNRALLRGILALQRGGTA